MGPAKATPKAQVVMQLRERRPTDIFVNSIVGAKATTKADIGRVNSQLQPRQRQLLTQIQLGIEAVAKLRW